MNIYQKLVEVRKLVPYLKKESQGHQYHYTGSSQVLAAVRLKMDELGLLLIPQIMSKEVTQETVEGVDGKGNPKKTTTYFTELTMNMTWVNAENPDEKINIPWYAQGIDTAGEKGVGKALTYAEKYFLLKQFNIATDKDDADSFQQKMETNAARAAMLSSNLIAQIKSEWQGAGGKINALNPWVQQNYQCRLVELTEEQATEIIEKIRSKKGGKAS